MVIFIKRSTLKDLGMLNPFGKEIKYEKRAEKGILGEEQYSHNFFYSSIFGIS